MTPPRSLLLLTVLLATIGQGPTLAESSSNDIQIANRPGSAGETAVRPAGRRTLARINVGAERLAPFFELASQLSQNRGWLTPSLLSELHRRGLWLNEVFTDAPALLKVDGTYYRIVLERDGKGWDDFNADSSPYFVYLTHEISDRLGSDRVEGFQEGNRSIFFARDLAALPAIGISLAELSAGEAREILVELKRTTRPEQAVAELGAPFLLGTARSRALDRAQPKPLPFANKDVCPRQIAPTSCNAGKPACSTPGYSPYFVLDSLLIREDHETFGSPEIELYPTRLDITPAAGSPQPTTGLIFSGRYVSDYAGQTVYLPDVNDKNQWYDISGGGLALFKSDAGIEFGATLIDDDKDAGKLILDGAKVNTTAVLTAAGGIRTLYKNQKKLDALGWVAAIWGIYQSLKGVLINNDDLYVESLGVANSLFCESAIYQGFPHSIQLDTTEWGLKGHFACINPVCNPAPPQAPSCTSSGGSCTSDVECCSGFCDTTNGGGQFFKVVAPLGACY